MAQPLSILHSNDPRTSTQQQKIYNELQSLEKEKEQLNYLDHTITEQEIRQAVKKFKNEKSSFVDKIRNEMIKASLESLMPADHVFTLRTLIDKYVHYHNEKSLCLFRRFS